MGKHLTPGSYRELYFGRTKKRRLCLMIYSNTPTAISRHFFRAGRGDLWRLVVYPKMFGTKKYIERYIQIWPLGGVIQPRSPRKSAS